MKNLKIGTKLLLTFMIIIALFCVRSMWQHLGFGNVRISTRSSTTRNTRLRSGL